MIGHSYIRERGSVLGRRRRARRGGRVEWIYIQQQRKREVEVGI